MEDIRKAFYKQMHFKGLLHWGAFYTRFSRGPLYSEYYLKVFSTWKISFLNALKTLRSSSKYIKPSRGFLSDLYLQKALQRPFIQKKKDRLSIWGLLNTLNTLEVFQKTFWSSSKHIVPSGGITGGFYTQKTTWRHKIHFGGILH